MTLDERGRIMESRAEIAVNKRAIDAMNCAQAVATTYSDLTDMSADDLEIITQSLGTGIGASMEGTCGAITGGAIIIGLMNKDTGRSQAMKETRGLIAGFVSQNGAVTCKELKGINTGCMLRSCEDCIRDVCGYIEYLV